MIASQIVHFLTFSGLALLLPLIREDLGISFVQAGMLSAAATASYALAQIPAGYASDRFGAKRLFFAGLLGWSLAALAIAAVSTYRAAIVILLVAGACRALLFAPGLTLMASWFPTERRASAMGLFLVGSFIGTIGVSLASPYLTASIGWRATFAAYASLGIVTALAFGIFGAERREEYAAGTVRLRDAWRLLRHKLIWVCNALQFIRFSATTAFNFWLPSLLLADRGLTMGSMGALVAMSAACAAAANPLGGYLSDRLKNPPLVIGGSLAVLACTSVLIASVESIAPLVAVIALHSIVLTIYFGPLFTVPVETLGRRTAGLAIGTGNLFANLGALVAASLLGLLKDLTGTFGAGFYLLAALCACGVLLSFVLARLRHDALSGQSALVRGAA